MTTPRAVLLVEDDALLAMTVTDLLEGCGLVVQAAESFAGALELLRCWPDTEAVVTDVDLGPGPDGVAVGAAVLAADLPHLRGVVYATGHAERFDRHPLGPREALLPKPYTTAELVAALCGLPPSQFQGNA